jgi:methylenetetrahydrofolate--tRNA-(uracil-5-)-methyltransferase
MIARGPDTLRHGPFKPKGLTDPATGKSPHAVLQLRQDNREGTLWNMVGMQTRMKRADQQRIFTSLPGLENAEFARFGSVHRNSFIHSPSCLHATLEFRNEPGLFFAGQITGVEGYVESTAGGLIAGLNAARRINGKEPLAFPAETAMGGLCRYISEDTRKDFQPMNITFGLIPAYFEMAKNRKMPKKDRRIATSKQALAVLLDFKRTLTL